MSNLIKNRILSIPFLKSLFFIQNEWHQHGVFLHTLRVTYYTVKAKDLKLISAALLHDVGKPFSAFKKDEGDIVHGEYSFTDHEEVSYKIIENWPFISDYTKNFFRYHYLFRDINKSKKENYK
ncbi:MAG: HD domain-containing protein, partial [Sulfurimonas sp.]|nr:HD domain-containing protein [Sulfurimonas sp.]